MNSSGERSDGFAMAVVVEGGLALVALVAAWIFHVPLRSMLPSAAAQLLASVFRGLLATVPMLIVFWVFVNSNWPMMRQLHKQVQWLIEEMFPSRSIAQFATVALLAGIGEELLFRGAIQSILVNWTTPMIGLAIASLLFGLAHALSKLYFLFAAIVGAFLGWMLLRYNDLVAPMVAHSVYDFVALVYLSLQEPAPHQPDPTQTDEFNGQT